MTTETNETKSSLDLACESFKRSGYMRGILDATTILRDAIMQELDNMAPIEGRSAYDQAKATNRYCALAEARDKIWALVEKNS